MKKPSVVTLVIIIILGVAILLGLNFYFYKKPGTQNPVSQAVVTSNNSIKQIAGNKLPADLPKDIILAKDATVISSYNAMPTDTQAQSTLIYKTSENIKLLDFEYQNYLAKNGWAIQVEKSGDVSTAASSTSIKVYTFDQKPMTVVKPGEGKTLLISASKSTTKDNEWLVSITLLTNRK